MGHSACIPIALYSHRKSIDWDLTGAVCFSVYFESHVCRKNLSVLIKPLEVVACSPLDQSRLIKTCFLPKTIRLRMIH